MANCHICKAPVTVGFVICTECAKGGTAQTMFECMTSSPKELAKWLDKICNGRGFSFDNQCCKGDCDNLEECQHELECIEKWLMQPMEESI